MSLLDTASLLLTPNAYKEGKLYSVIPSNGNGDFTATRATTATRVNSAGLVDLVPYNLVPYSEQFDNAAWLKSNTSVTANATTAPNGTLTADKLVGTENNPILYQDLLTLNGVSATISVYAKKSELNWLRLTNNSATYAAAWFNLNTGTIGTITGTATPTATITSVGDGWYRCTLTMLFSNAATADVLIACTNADNTTTGYTGNGTDGIFIWGAQLVEGTSARDYLRTETRLNIPRIDYSLGGCPNILLEPQRTNLALQSSSFDSATWVKGNSTVTANTTTSPSGIVDADTFTANGTSNTHGITQIAISVTSGTSYSLSFYAKKSTNDFIQATIPGGFPSTTFANFDLNNGVLGTIGSTATATITNVGNGWYRCTMTSTATVTTGAVFALNLITSATSVRNESNSLSTSVFLWGAQVEAGAYATSYIPTTTASVTRNADSITRNNIFTNGLITAAGGTWFVELRGNVARTRDASSNGLFLSSTSTGSGGDTLGFQSTGGAVRMSVFRRISGAFASLFTLTTDNAKVAIKWNGTTADVFVDGVKVVSATSFTATNLDFLSGLAADVPKYINEMALFPTPLTDAQLAALTA